METESITLIVPREILREIEAIAAREGQSVSDPVTLALEQLVAREEAYGAARQRQLQALDSPHGLGTAGKSAWTRDELHER